MLLLPHQEDRAVSVAFAPPVPPLLEPGRKAELDAIVARARAAADAFRSLDQEAVDRIVRAMVVAGLQAAIELAQLAIEETGFGIFEDKVVKNYVATEFLYDYLKEKRTEEVALTDLVALAELTAESLQTFFSTLDTTIYSELREIAGYIEEMKAERPMPMRMKRIVLPPCRVRARLCTVMATRMAPAKAAQGRQLLEISGKITVSVTTAKAAP